jgi:hypothetical protein
MEPGAPVPPISPVLGVPAPPGVLLTTYREYYDDDTHNNAGGDYGAIMATFSMPVATALTPQQVTDAVYTSAVMDPQAPSSSWSPMPITQTAGSPCIIDCSAMNRGSDA